MAEALFELDEFVETAPAPRFYEMWPCELHTVIRDDDEHVAECWRSMCPCCGDEVVNGWIMRLNHWGAETGMCVSLGLRLNHLTYDIRNGRLPHDRDMTAIDLGWRIAGDGTQIPPLTKSPG